MIYKDNILMKCGLLVLFGISSGSYEGKLFVKCLCGSDDGDVLKKPIFFRQGNNQIITIRA